MTNSAKVWIYQSSREFTKEEIEELNLSLTTFVSTWQAHGADLTADFQLIENRFIVFLVDEKSASASGCSIDSSVGFIKDVSNKYSINLTDKGQVAFWINEKIEVIPFKDIKSTIESGQITPSTIIFNNSVATYKEYQENWQIEAQNSWMKKYFN
jgi:hypothetical protein